MAAARRDMNRTNNDRGERDENAYRKQPARTNDLPRRPEKPDLNEYWIDKEGIHREVLQKEICKYLGNEATCRPGEYNDMLDDIRAASKAFSKENNAYQKRHDRDLAYENSQTYNNENSNPAMEYPERTMYPGRGSPSYNGSSAYGPPPIQAPYPVSTGAYPSTSTYAVHPGVPASSPMPSDPRYPVPDNGNYYHPRGDARDPRDSRDSRDPRDPRNDSGGYGAPAPYAGTSYQEQYPPPPSTYGNDPYRGGAPDPRADPRMNQQDYYSNGSSYAPNGRDHRGPDGYYDQMQGVSGPGSYAPPPPQAPPSQGRGTMSPQYSDAGRQNPYRPDAVDPRYRR